MKKLVLAVIAITACLQAWPQKISEPEFIGEAVIIDLKTGQFRKLPKERAIKRNANFMGYQTVKLVMKDEISPLEISDKTDCAIIIKAENNSYDPMALFQIFRFDENAEGKRVCELASTSTGDYYAEGNANNKKYIDFDAKKYGETSYLLSFPISAGQYGVMTGALNDDALIIATFGVYDSAKREAAEYEAARKLQIKKEKEQKKAARHNNR